MSRAVTLAFLFLATLVLWGCWMELRGRKAQDENDNQLAITKQKARSDGGMLRDDYAKRMERERWWFARRLRQFRAGLYVEAKRRNRAA